jgi:hypothetical protein
LWGRIAFTAVDEFCLGSAVIVVLNSLVAQAATSSFDGFYLVFRSFGYRVTDSMAAVARTTG